MNKIAPIDPIDSVKSPLPKLSPREVELLKYISDGLSNREIARRKGVKVKTCENAISRVAKKLEVPQSPLTNQRILLAKRYFDRYINKI